MAKTTQLQTADKAKKMLAWALTERLDTPTADGTIDLPGFKILDTLGKGGMGTVYRAIHEDLGRTVALKIFTPKGKDYDLFVERLKREGQLMAQLEHPNVLGIYDAAVMEDGTPYLVLEYVKGEDLQKRLARDKRLSQRTAVRIAIKICEALSAVHALGIVHRDIKPANVLLGEDGMVKVTDFGISKDVRGDDKCTSLTMTGTTVGTADYMSPEQTRNEEMSARSDLYSVGVLLYEMLMGVTPRGKFESLSKAGVPKNLEAVILRCLQRDRQKRPASAATLAHSLRKIYRQVNTRQHRDMKALAIYAVVAFGLIGLVVYLSAHDSGGKVAETVPLKLNLSPVGTWRADNYRLIIEEGGGCVISMREATSEKILAHGSWVGSRDGGNYLRFHKLGAEMPTASHAEYFRIKGEVLHLFFKGSEIKFTKMTQP